MSDNTDTEPNGRPSTADHDADSQDRDLLAQARDHIAQEFGGQPPDVQLSIEDKRIRIAGKVRDADTAQRIAKAAAIGPGVLGVHNDLAFDVGTDAAQPLAGAQAAGDMPKEAAERGVPLEPPEGVIHHKV